MRRVFGFLAVFLLAIFLSSQIISRAEQTEPAQKSPLPFPDVAEDCWAYSVISQLVNRKLIAGYPDGTFRPENTLSRAEFAAFLARAANLPVQQPDRPVHQDVEPDAWYAPVIGATYKYIGDFSGSGDGRLFKPTEPILREQAIAAFLRARQEEEKTPVNPDILAVRFKDHGEIAAQLKNMLGWAVEQNLVGGYPDGTFRPRGTLTRAEAAALLARMFPQIELSLKAFLKSGKLTPLTEVAPQYARLVEKLQQDYPHLAVNQTPVQVRYFAGDFSPGLGSKENLLYIYGAIDPFKYFSFSDVDFKNKPEAVLEFNEAVAHAVASIFPDRQVIVLIGYVNTVYYNPAGVYEGRFISYDEKEHVWRIVRYYTGVRGKGDKILEKWIAT